MAALGRGGTAARRLCRPAVDRDARDHPRTARRYCVTRDEDGCRDQMDDGWSVPHRWLSPIGCPVPDRRLAKMIGNAISRTAAIRRIPPTVKMAASIHPSGGTVAPASAVIDKPRDCLLYTSPSPRDR